MTSRDFCMRLRGWLEIADDGINKPQAVEKKQLDCIRKHLDLVFAHEIDPSFPEDQQDLLNSIHEGSGGPNQPPKPPEEPVLRC